MDDIDRKKRVFNQVVAHRPYVMNVIAQKMKNSTAAEDVVQDALMKAWRNIDRFKEGTNAQAWLFRIANNTFLDYCRTNKKRTVNHFEISELIDTPDQNVDQLSMLSLHDIEAIIDVVEPQHWSYFEMRLNGYQYDEIAEHFDVPLGTVKNRIFRVRDQLRAYMNHDGTLRNEIS